MATDYKERLTQFLAWTFLVGFLAIYGWGVIIAFTTGEDNDLYSYFGTGFAALVAGVVAAVFGQPAPLKPPTRLIAAYVIAYCVTGIVGILVWVLCKGNTPVVVRTVATGFFGLGVAIVGAYLKPPSLFGQPDRGAVE